MAVWGSPWGTGFTWGLLSGPGPNRFCLLAEERVLAQMDDTPGSRNFRDLMCLLAEEFGEFEDVSQSVSEGFDLSDATGTQLDTIGALVGLRRSGFSDLRYRVFLQIQVELLLSSARDDANWTGTHENVLAICRTFIGPGPDPIVLLNSPPYSFLLSVPGLVLSELQLLIAFICKAIYAAVLGQIIIVLASDSLWDSSTVGPIPDGGIWCASTVAVVPCATWNFAITIGPDSC